AIYLYLTILQADQILYPKRPFPSHAATNIALKADRMLTFVPIVFILVHMWGTLRWILFMYADIGKLHTWWHTALLCLQRSSILQDN
ncbi:unnamed protein product, partial [Porites evermanni]